MKRCLLYSRSFFIPASITVIVIVCLILAELCLFAITNSLLSLSCSDNSVKLPQVLELSAHNFYKRKTLLFRRARPSILTVTLSVVRCPISSKWLDDGALQFLRICFLHPSREGYIHILLATMCIARTRSS